MQHKLKLRYDNEHPFQSCITCDKFDEKEELCTLFKTKPPAKVIVYGCEKWEDKIPF